MGGKQLDRCSTPMVWAYACAAGSRVVAGGFRSSDPQVPWFIPLWDHELRDLAKRSRRWRCHPALRPIAALHARFRKNRMLRINGISLPEAGKNSVFWKFTAAELLISWPIQHETTFKATLRARF